MSQKLHSPLRLYPPRDSDVSSRRVKVLASFFFTVLALTIVAPTSAALAEEHKSGPPAWGLIWTVAGNGRWGYSGDGGPALEAQLRVPLAVTEDNYDGSLLIADSGNGLIRQVRPDGTIRRVAGNGLGGCPRDGERATETAIGNPIDVERSAWGGYFFTSFLCDRVYKVSSSDPDKAVITRFAGSGVRGFAGDGGPAREARLSFPLGIGESSEGGLVIADSGNNRVRYVDSRGDISTVAGNGTYDCSDYDGSSALSASVSEPVGIAVRRGGFNVAFYVTETRRQIVSYVDSVTDGTITRVAGQPCLQGFSGDGGSPQEARLNDPSDVVEATGRGVLIADRGNARIRQIDESGRIWTVAGNGEEGSLDDWIPARESGLSLPRGLGVSTDGGFFVTDTGNGHPAQIGSNRVRYVAPPE